MVIDAADSCQLSARMFRSHDAQCPIGAISASGAAREDTADDVDANSSDGDLCVKLQERSVRETPLAAQSYEVSESFWVDVILGVTFFYIFPLLTHSTLVHYLMHYTTSEHSLISSVGKNGKNHIKLSRFFAIFSIEA